MEMAPPSSSSSPTPANPAIDPGPPACKWCDTASPAGIQNLLCPAKCHILYRILTLASAPKDGLSPTFYHICKDWCELIDKNLVAEDTFGEADNVFNYQDIRSLNDNLLHACYFMQIKDNALPPEIQYAKHIKSATFGKEIVTSKFLKLVPMLHHLQSLTLGQDTLFSLHRKGLSCLKKLEQLEVFAVCGDFMQEQNIRPFRRDWCHNTNMLLRALDVANFPKLIQLVCSKFVIPHSNHDGHIVGSFFDCMVRHRTTLKHVTFETTLVEDGKPQDRRKDVYMPSLNIKELEGLRLISLFFGGQLSTQLPGTQELFLRIFETQAPKELRYVFCNFSSLPNPLSTMNVGPRKAKRYFNKSLTVLELMLRGDRDAEIDCEALFGHCQELRVLSLAAGTKRRGPPRTVALTRQRATRAQLLNISKLPKSLQFFRVRRLSVSKNDGEFIVWELPELRFLELVEIGTSRGLGLHFRHFEELMASRHIERLIFFHAFCRKSMKASTLATLQANQENGDSPPRPVYSTQLDDYEKKHGYVCMKRSPTVSNHYAIIANKQVLPASYYPFKISVGAYRPRPSPDSDDPHKPRFDWVNNPYLQHALSFNYPLADTGNEVDGGSTDSESGESDSDDDNHSSWNPENEATGSSTATPESATTAEFTEAEAREDDGETDFGDFDPSQLSQDFGISETEFGEVMDAIAEVFENGDLEMEGETEIGDGDSAGVGNSSSLRDIVLASIEQSIANISNPEGTKEAEEEELDEVAEAEGVADAERQVQAGAGAAQASPAKADYNSDEDEEIKKGKAAIKTFTGGHFYEFRQEFLEKQAAEAAAAAARASEEEEATRAEAEVEDDVPDSEESDTGMDANEEMDAEEMEQETEQEMEVDPTDADADDERMEQNESDDSDDELME